jgi:hypothetical protein
MVSTAVRQFGADLAAMPTGRQHRLRDDAPLTCWELPDRRYVDLLDD